MKGAPASIAASTSAAVLSKRGTRLLIVLFVFSIAMAAFEAVVVIYIREQYHPVDLAALFPFRAMSRLDTVIETLREAASVLMMTTVAFLSVRRGMLRRFASFVFIFGCWDILFYVWLKILIGWPTSFLEWDILFLIPWAWFGPWICPVCIAALFAVWGGVILTRPTLPNFRPYTVAIFLAGSALCLAVFLVPGMERLIPSGLSSIAGFIPDNFLWGLFIPGFLLMAAGLWLPFFQNGPGKRKQRIREIRPNLPGT